ncbi:hypothetical protein NPIL_591021 [Nephila pilipes]|uniref:Uncharacterized protein n=1 Tax=Nephila pilipes TaxID=299642 RepID=A0A8X6IBF1_NEPPI|nr:hypothetical protein NPIL_591021 [Nephila pilipes]
MQSSVCSKNPGVLYLNTQYTEPHLKWVHFRRYVLGRYSTTTVLQCECAHGRQQHLTSHGFNLITNTLMFQFGSGAFQSRQERSTWTPGASFRKSNSRGFSSRGGKGTNQCDHPKGSGASKACFIIDRLIQNIENSFMKRQDGASF